MPEDKPKRKVDRWATNNYFQDKIIKEYQLKPIDIAVWHAMFRHGDQWGIIKMSKKRIRDESGIVSKHTLNRILEKLIELKLIGLIRAGGWNENEGRFCSVWWHRAIRLDD